MKEVILTPNYEQTAAFIAHQLTQKSFEEKAGYNPVISLIEQVRYLYQTDPTAVERLLIRLRSFDRSHGM